MERAVTVASRIEDTGIGKSSRNCLLSKRTNWERALESGTLYTHEKRIARSQRNRGIRRFQYFSIVNAIIEFYRTACVSVR